MENAWRDFFPPKYEEIPPDLRSYCWTAKLWGPRWHKPVTTVIYPVATLVQGSIIAFNTWQFCSSRKDLAGEKYCIL